MHLDLRFSRLALAAVTCLALTATVGCGDDDDPVDLKTDGSGGDTGTPPPDDPGPPTSPKPNVKFKTGAKLRQELARALSLPQDELCKELGAFDCFAIHNIALGGTDPLGAGLYEPLSATTASTPIAVERVTLAACQQRMDIDLASPESAVILRDVPIADGRISDLESDGVTHFVDALYQRGLSRRAKPHEIDALRELYGEMEAANKSDALARDWATLSCMAVLTTMESLFY